MKKLLLTTVACVFAISTAFAEPSVYEPALQTDSNFTQLSDGSKIHSIEAGSGETIVFLHGLPASAYLWRDVITNVGKQYKAIAPDLPGYGHSDIAKSGDVSLAASAKSLTEYLNSLEDDKFTLVVTDMGSVLGLNYAIKNPERIDSIVLSEAVFQPPEDFMAQIRPEHREFIMAAQDPAFVKQITIDKPVLIDMAMQNNTLTTLSEETLQNYRAPYYEPYTDFQSKRQTLNAVFGPEGLQNFGMFAFENAQGLLKLDIPILLVKATPGYMVNSPAVEYAKKNFKNITITEIPDAHHFFAEDNPDAFSNAIINWLAK